jgi:hypothetical protein
MAKRVNPYREGSNYHRIFGFVQDKKGKAFTKSEILTRFENELEITGKEGSTKTSAGKASVDVVCGPSETNQGNYSSQGHLYYMNRLTRKTVKDADGKEKKEEQRYQLRWREEPQVKIRREDAYLTAEQIAERNQRKADAKAERQAAKEAEAQAVAERRAERLKKKTEREAAEAKAKKERDEKREKRKKEREAEEKAKQEKREAKAKARKEKAEAAEAAKQAKADEREAKRQKRLEDAEAAKQAKEEAKEVPAETEDAEAVSEADGVEAEETQGEIAEA